MIIIIPIDEMEENRCDICGFVTLRKEKAKIEYGLGLCDAVCQLHNKRFTAKVIHIRFKNKKACITLPYTFENVQKVEQIEKLSVRIINVPPDLQVLSIDFETHKDRLIFHDYTLKTHESSESE